MTRPMTRKTERKVIAAVERWHRFVDNLDHSGVVEPFPDTVDLNELVAIQAETKALMTDGASAPLGAPGYVTPCAWNSLDFALQKMAALKRMTLRNQRIREYENGTRENTMTSPVRAAVRIANSSALAATPRRARSAAMYLATSLYGKAA